VGCSSRCVRRVGAQNPTVLSPCLLGDCVPVSISPARDDVGKTYGVIGMLECLRAPSTALGVAAAGDLPLVSSWGFGVSTSSRLNCELFMVRQLRGWWTVVIRKRCAKPLCQRLWVAPAPREATLKKRGWPNAGNLGRSTQHQPRLLPEFIASATSR
jgi:hypothetical protein